MRFSNIFGFSVLIAVTFFSCTKTVHDRRSRVTNSPDSREYFGCRVNGSGFVSEARTNNVSGSCTYLPVYGNSDARLFQLYSNKFYINCRSGTVGIVLDSVALEAGTTYNLGSPGPRKNYGSYYYVPSCGSDRVELFTSDTDDIKGKITITSFDPVKKVVKGTFYFTVRGSNGDFYQITGGIFDRHFTEG